MRPYILAETNQGKGYKLVTATWFGNSGESTKEKEETYFKALTEKMGNLFVDLCKADI